MKRLETLVTLAIMVTAMLMGCLASCATTKSFYVYDAVYTNNKIKPVSKPKLIHFNEGDSLKVLARY